MIEWTETARRTLDEYCKRSKTVLAGSGADADEVIEDLRRHIDEDVAAARLTVVTEGDIRRILARFGEPKSAENQPRPEPVSRSSPREGKKPGFILLMLGIILPLGTLVFELVTRISAGILFDPLASWLHVAMVAWVPATNFWVWHAGRARNARSAKLLGWLNGISMGICLFYTVLYLPVTPFATMGVVYYGLGLVPLAPLIALVATPFLRASYAERISRETLPGAAWGILAGIGILALLQLPVALTYSGLTQAAADDQQTKMKGVRLLRQFGDRDLILRACYGLLRNDFHFDLVRSLATGKQDIAIDHAREMYYRVTGKAFNSVPPPSLYTRAGRWTALEQELTWDEGLGKDQVAGRVKGLALSSSRMDAVAEPDAAIVYCEWTMEFKNVSTQEREARAQIALPPGGVVSRLTLWINGEEREAAFGGRSQVRQAYQDVAVEKRRDPVLVTTCGPDRALVQCFPVPPDGGVMKVRLGISTPLILEAPDRGQFAWPRFLERNFGVNADFKHALWIESSARLSAASGAAVSSKTNSRPFALHETLAEADWGDSARCVAVHRAPGVSQVWTPAADGNGIIDGTIRPVDSTAPSRLVFVLDGSASMQGFASEIADTLSAVPEATEIAVIIADDEPRSLDGRSAPTALQRATAAVVNQLAQRLRRTAFRGGQDNLPALELAWDLAAAVENGAVVWIHQPQAALLSSETTLRQAVERTAVPTRLFEIQTRNGPDRIIEKLDGLSAIKHVARLGSLRSDLGSLFAHWAGQDRFEQVRQRLSTLPAAAAGTRVSAHLERLWARDETLRLAAKRQREAATKLATGHQLVTPLTGAVVLETQQQFTQHGLRPGDPASVPSVPEPQVSTLLLLGIAASIIRRFAKRTRSVGK